VRIILFLIWNTFFGSGKAEIQLVKLWSRHKHIDFLFSGRTAILHILRNNPLKRKTDNSVLIPDYLLKTVESAAEESGYKIVTYPVLADFKPDKTLIIQLIIKHKPSVLLVASIFGSSFLEDDLLYDNELRSLIQVNKTLILYDLCQDLSLINRFCPDQQLPYSAIGSFNDKYIPGIVGAVLLSNIPIARATNRTNYFQKLYLLKWLINREFNHKNFAENFSQRSEKKSGGFLFDLSQERACSVQLVYAWYLISRKQEGYAIQRKLNARKMSEHTLKLPYQETSQFIICKDVKPDFISEKPNTLCGGSENIFQSFPNAILNHGFEKLSWGASIFTFSTYTNAWSLYKGLGKLNQQLNALNFRTIYFLPQTKLLPAKGDALLFTDENFLKKYVSQPEDFFFHPKEFSIELVDDKLLFAEALISMGESPVDHYSDITKATYPAYLKLRSSWKNDIRLPKGGIVNSLEDIDCLVDEYASQGILPSMLFLQKLMKDSISSNVSVSGYFDWENQDNSISLVTSKLQAAGGNTFATGSLIKTINDPCELRNRTYFILRNLKYKGPFELEFYFDSDDNLFKVLELNPRFWMQHGLFVNFLDNALLKKYFELEGVERLNDNYSSKLKAIWVDGAVLYEKAPALSFFKELLVLLSYRIQGYRVLIAPDVFTWLASVVRFKRTH
jgi:hypothetical protein